MTRTAAGILVGLVVVSARAEAKCVPVTSCFCFTNTTVGVVVTEQVDGTSSELRVESGNAGLDGGALFTMPSEAGETVGSRWLVLDSKRLPVDAAGNVRCEFAQEKALSASAVAAAAAGPSCPEAVTALGLEQPPCYACSVSPVLFSPLLLGWLLLRRRGKASPAR